MRFIVNVIESVRVLKSEFFATRLETRARELLTDLKSELCSARLDAKLSEPLTDLKRELLRVLENVSCSAKLEAEPIASLSCLAKPFV